MAETPMYAVAADLVLVTHFLFVVFIVLGLLLVFIGKLLNWLWVRNPWFRAAHLMGIAVVVVQSWFGVICPLTTWEMALRARAGEAAYQGSFISHWLGELLYYQAPAWVFVVCYSVFGGLVLLSWFLVRPRAFCRHGREVET
jgi:hypothetical protein